MAVKIEVVGDAPATLTSTTNETKTVVVTQAPTVVTGTPNTAVAIEVLKGKQGDDRVFVGDTPPDNPQEGWIWIDTSG